MNPKTSNQEIFEAVRFHPFFQGVEESTALSLLESCQHKLFEKGDIIHQAGTTRTGLILILSGSAEIYIEKNQHEEILEVVQKGELIGLSSLADFLGVSQTSEPQVDARAVTSVSALFIPFDVIMKRWDDANVHDYLLAQISIRLKDVYTSLAEQIKLSKAFFEKGAILARVQDMMREGVVAVSAQQSIIEAAKTMSREKVSSVLVLEEEQLVGIVTERDIVSRVVSEGLSYTDASLKSIMTEKPLTIDRFAYYYEALSVMLVHSVKHLPVMENGRLVGMVTLTDLLRKKNESYIKTIRSIEEAKEEKLPQIKMAIYDIVDTLIRDQVPALKLLDTVTNLYDRLIARIVSLAVEKLEVEGRAVPGAFAFYLMGSGGRGEQFLLTDQDHFLVYDSGDNEYYARLGFEITRLLECAGYRRCVGKMMSCEKQWRGSVADWGERFRSWMVESSNETLLLAQNFLSYRFLAGSRDVHQQFEAGLSENLQRSKIFLYRLTQAEREHVIQTLDGPFWGLLKRDKKLLDMKRDVLFPFHHSLQILSLLKGDLSGTPQERLEKLVQRGVFSDESAEGLMASLEHVLSLYIRLRWDNAGESSLLSLAQLTTREKNNLGESLKAFRELQGIVFAHFSL